MSNLAADLRTIRNEKGVTLQKLANKAGISYNTVSNFELDKRLTSLDIVDAMFDALGYELIPIPKEED